MSMVELRRTAAISNPGNTATAVASDTPAAPPGRTAAPPPGTMDALHKIPVALTFFITQAGNINQSPQVLLLLLNIDMKIADLVANPKLAIEQVRSEMLSHIRPGRTVQARVLESPQQGIARLRIGSAEIMIRTQLPLVVNEQLLLDVVKAKNSDQLMFRLPQQATLKHYQARALRTLLPQQIPLRSLVEGIRQLISDTPGKIPASPLETRQPAVLETPTQRGTQPHQQLIRTLRSLAPETLRNTPFPDIKSASVSTRAEKSGDLSGRFVSPTKTAQLLQRLVESRLPTSPKTAPARAPATQISTPSTPALSRLERPLPSYPSIILPALSKAVTASSTDQIRTSMPTPSPGVPSNRPAGTPRELLGKEIMQRIQRVLNHSINDDNPLSASRLRHAFDTSGLFLESTLASGTVPTTDMKASLLQLLLHLRPGSGHSTKGRGQRARESGTLQAAGLRILSELQALTEGALARIQVNQLTSLPQDEGTRQVWQFELPFVMPNSTDSFLIRVEQEEKNSDTEAGGWAVTLQFNLEPLGPMSARLSLLEDEISSHFTAQLAESSKLLELALPQLAEAYIRAGLKVGKLSCRQGMPTDLNTQAPPIDLPLLDEKA
ncbi:MAG: flagellar hook-length control protein FliK [Sedimenticola sp.]